MKRFVAAILAASLVAVAVVPAGATASSTGSQNIVQVASSLPQFTELVKLVKAAGLVSALEGQVEADPATTDDHARVWFRRYWTFRVGYGAHVLVHGLPDFVREQAERDVSAGAD